MSVIFGYIDLTGKPISKETPETMRKSMSYWIPDAEAIWVENSCCLGNMLIYNTPEAVYEKLPLSNKNGNLLLTSSARIDNREELFRAFHTPATEQSVTPDSALILLAYEKWGADCVHHLLGDWAFAVWDKAEQKLFIARDHHGVSALYYYKGANFFVFATMLKGVLSLPEVPKKINELRIAQILVAWHEGGTETCYNDIFCLPPAHTLTLKNNKVTTNQYWYLEDTPELILKDEQEYLDMFMDIYTQAVRCRLRSYRPLGATLSSGFDSGSVCALAAQELGKDGKRLQAFTSVPLYDITGLVPPNRIGDEGPMAKAVADFCENIDLTLCKAENITPLQGIERMLEILQEPMHAAPNAYWIIDIFEKAKAAGFGTILTGQGGNATVSWPDAGFMAFINKAPRPEKLFWNFQQIKQFYIKPLVPAHLRNQYAKLKMGAKPWRTYSIISPNFEQRINLKKEMKKRGWDPYFTMATNHREQRFKIIKPGKNPFLSVWAQFSTYYKIEMRDPTTDLNVLKFTISTPDSIFNKDCSSRYFVKKTFTELLPNEILSNTRRGLQSADIDTRLKKEGLLKYNELIDTIPDLYKYNSAKNYSQKIRNSLHRSAMVTKFLNNL